MVIVLYVIVFSERLAMAPLFIVGIRTMEVGILKGAFFLIDLHGIKILVSIVMMMTLMFVMMSVTIPIIAI